MTPIALLKLVNSLSGAEKRYFRLYAAFQEGAKEYVRLFELMTRSTVPDIRKLKQAFLKEAPEGTWENTCSYLGKTLLAALVTAKKEKDVFIELLQRIQEAKILKERSLEEEALKVIKKVHRKAVQYQLPWVEYYCQRYILNQYADNNFSELSEAALVKLQMNGKHILKGFHHIHDHYSLYELLKYRLIHGGKVISEEGRKKLNDLMLSETVLIASKSKSFTSQKLHLLFQSFFFTDIGDYTSALKSFYQLNALLEKNEDLLDKPPVDYLEALNGIIDSLRILHNKTEIRYYISKLKKLDRNTFPEYFRYLVRKTVALQEMAGYLLGEEWEAALHFLKTIPADIFHHYAMVDEEKQSALYFYAGLVHFKSRDFKKAHLLIREVMTQFKLPKQLMISRAIRLLNIITYYEKGELLHLEYEIRSYKRYFMQLRLLKTEKLLFRIIALTSVGSKRLRLMEPAAKKILTELQELTANRYEQQLLNYFDFTGWMKEQTNNLLQPVITGH
ncbi:hypothetical protein A8C56_20735 [Niabella ginsenosidivorans]|uniref:Uncharacterized protein n=1 Tax=Niabella ginsenosidivorans TaxID=1176587 RepID=A0A1A9I8T9_9BACT|nr:hypothetical protein [Niabella ginsenosidivorans]ANH83082.1 hypothetical protein A8C56_20735 [Niabella ginsenosidivorans]